MRFDRPPFVYDLVPDAHGGWKLATIKTSAKRGEYESNVVYPGTFPQALRSLLERMTRDGLPPDASLDAAVATVAHMYATIGAQVTT